MPAWLAIAIEVAKGVGGLIIESIGASAKQLEELGERFNELMRVGAEELRAAREDSARAEGFTKERREAALARIRAARIAQAAAPPAEPTTSEEPTKP